MRFPEFSGEWKESTIEEQFDLYSGNTPSRLDKSQFQGDVNWISSGELKTHYIADTVEKITEEAATGNNLRILPIGTFVIAIYGLEAAGVRGTCSITKEPSTISQACMAFLPKGEIENEFLYSWYKKHGNVIGIRYAQGTKQQNLSYDIINKFHISYPSKEKATKLQSFITAIDERIATQIGLIEDLKKLKSAIIHLYFDESNAPIVVLSNYLRQVSQRNKGGKNYPVLSVSNKSGFVSQSEQFEDRVIASDDTSNYKVVDKDMFAYNPARINVGSIARYSGNNCGIVSPMYVCFRTTEALLPQYFEYYFHTIAFKHEMYKRLEGSVRLCLTFESLTNIRIALPPLEEQKKIAERLSAIEQKITVETEIKELYARQQQFLLSQMFV